MHLHDLDNPFWTALASRHAGCAMRHGDVARYPADTAPFLCVSTADVDPHEAFNTLIGTDEDVYLLGLAPNVPAGWQLQSHRPLAQMICERPIEITEGPDIVMLTEAQCDDVLALTALVYPHYFRPRTMSLGRYFGIYAGGQLAAMAGERLASDGFQEVSAICTHPDFNGRGYARRLTAMLTNDILSQQRQPYLHVSYENPRAKSIYEGIGYRLRRDIPFWTLARAR